MKYTITQKVFRIILGALMALAGIGHLTFQRQEFQAQVPRWLPDDPAFIDFVVLASGVTEILLGLSMIFLTKHRIKVGLILAIFYVLITAVLGVVSLAWSQLESYLGRLARYKLEAAVSDQMTEQFLALEYWRYDDKETADLLDKSRRFSNFFTSMFDTLGSILTALIGLISSVIALAFVSWWLGMLLLIAVIPGLVIQYRLSKARTNHWAQNVESRRKAGYIGWYLWW